MYLSQIIAKICHPAERHPIISLQKIGLMAHLLLFSHQFPDIDTIIQMAHPKKSYFSEKFILSINVLKNTIL